MVVKYILISWNRLLLSAEGTSEQEPWSNDMTRCEVVSLYTREIVVFVNEYHHGVTPYHLVFVKALGWQAKCEYKDTYVGRSI
jgi:hypothetical protein